jgi:uncharacterized protein YyaL (SSP411 family)
MRQLNLPNLPMTLLGCALYLGIQGFAAAYHLERPMEIEQQLHAAYAAKGPDYQPRTEHLRPDGSPVYINRLILEDSPYLLQHAHNPVDWYAWGEAAFARAKQEDKPVFLSIGYSTCHWCHVMERESFENPEIAKFLNQHFISIKVDRESHPDVDDVYMTAVLLMNGHGGWPMSSFLTPEGRPFLSGTYYPPNRFVSILQQIRQLWLEQRAVVLAQAAHVAKAVEESNQRQGQVKALDPEIVSKATRQVLSGFDELQGGFSQAPKFPHEPLLYLLLNQAERRRDQAALQALDVTLDAMARGGVYDQVAGGFHRYSTDNAWLVPHFEKMLYNQAQLARIYVLAWGLTGREQYRRVATQTLDYVLREMTAPEGGFYSATDADSEGEEGAFFLWTPAQIRNALTAEDAELAIRLYSVTNSGNFEGRNILHLARDLEDYAREEKIPLPTLQQRVDRINRLLREVRERREHPLRDDKILTAWNGMMLSALAQAADLLSSEAYRKAAVRAAEFLWRANRQAPGRLWRVHLAGQSSIPANQEDYAYLAEGLLHLYDLTHDAQWLQRARELADAMLERFLDSSGGFFMNEADAGITAMGRPRDDGADNATPAGSSVALRVLQMLWYRTGEMVYRDQANGLIGRFAAGIERHPSAYAYLLTGIDDLRNGELSARGYAARGGIRMEARLRPLSDGKQLINLTIQIPEGWHINANRPRSDDLIGTEIQQASENSAWKLGPVTYPEARLERLGFSNEPLALYTGEIQLQALAERIIEPVGPSPLRLGVTLQACNQEVCLAPDRVELWLEPCS